LNTYNAPGLLEGGSEFTVAVTPPVAVLVPQAARKASRLTAPAPTNTERFKKLLRLNEDPKLGVAPMNDLPP
jgi:hypothetical protein